MANNAVGEILCKRNFDVTELNHLTYTAAMVITEEINGRKEYKLQTQNTTYTSVDQTHTKHHK